MLYEAQSCVQEPRRCDSLCSVIITPPLQLRNRSRRPREQETQQPDNTKDFNAKQATNLSSSLWRLIVEVNWSSRPRSRRRLVIRVFVRQVRVASGFITLIERILRHSFIYSPFASPTRFSAVWESPPRWTMVSAAAAILIIAQLPGFCRHRFIAFILLIQIN